MEPSPWWIVIGLLCVYFVPTLVACMRGKAEGQAGVFIVNIALGWTLIGWLVAFVWACSGRTSADVRAEQQRHAELLGALSRPQQQQP